MHTIWMGACLNLVLNKMGGKKLEEGKKDARASGRPQKVRSMRDKDEARERCRVLLAPQKTHQILQSPVGNLTKYLDKICLPVTSSP